MQPDPRTSPSIHSIEYVRSQLSAACAAGNIRQMAYWMRCELWQLAAKGMEASRG